MKIWTITTESDNGIVTEVLHTEAAADGRATAIVESYWQATKTGRMTKDIPLTAWRVAYEALQDNGAEWTMQMAEHDISTHPDIAAAIASVDVLDDLGNSDIAMVNDETMASIQQAQLEVRAALTSDPSIWPAFGMSENLAAQISDLEVAYREAAQAHATDDLEVDNDATVSLGDDGGAFVSAWLWVSDTELPKHLQPKSEDFLQ